MQALGIQATEQSYEPGMKISTASAGPRCLIRPLCPKLEPHLTLIINVNFQVPKNHEPFQDFELVPIHYIKSDKHY